MSAPALAKSRRPLDGRIERIDLIEVKPQQEAMVLGYAAADASRKVSCDALTR
jgi:hypothetical protein